ncbi:YD repeat-containing protein [Methylobacterium sp. ap11]|nr:YD repeat-containing protein [Methylobacterium sp. ap11]
MGRTTVWRPRRAGRTRLRRHRQVPRDLHDFPIPATLPFDGARSMGLKLPLPPDYTSPLGPCQISMFDEIVANPEPGQLDFHQADGKVVRFDRPFNFLASHNAGYPHLDLRAPWLRQLELRDRRLIKHFCQDEDDIYRLARIEDLDWHAISFLRDADGVLERAEGTDGLALAFTNDERGRRTGITLIGTDGSRLDLARYAYDARGRMTEADCAFGMSVDYLWHPDRDLLAAWHNRTRRSQTRFTYDADGRVLHTATNGLWNDDRFAYDPETRRTTYLPGGDPACAQRFAYDENHNVTAETDALGHTVSRTFDQAGFETALTDPNGHTTTKTYDLWGNPKSVVDPEGRSTEYGWGPEGQLDLVVDGAGHIRRYEHDEHANVVAEIDAEGNVTRHERDEAGRLLCTTFPDGSQERRTYDSHGRLASLTDPRGGTTRYAYDAFGRQVALTDAAGQTSRFAYDAGAGGFATPTTLIRPDGISVSRQFAEDGVLASVSDGEGRTWRYAYGAFDVLQAIEDPRGGRLTLSHDGEGRVVAVTNQTGHTYHLIRDPAGWVAAEVDFDGRRTEYTRDPAGRVIATRKPDGARLRYAYDRSDRLTTIRTHAADDPEGARPRDETHLRYDGRGLLVEASSRAARVVLERDGNGRIVSETTNGRRVESRLDGLGRRIERRIGAGQPGASLVRIGRDPLGALASLAIDDHAPLMVSRDPLGRETRRASSKGFVLEQAFDPVGQLTRQRSGREGQAGRAYAWDKAGDPTLIDDALFGPARYCYDGNGQVAQASFCEGLTEEFDYHAAKNVVGVLAEGPEAGEILGALRRVEATSGGAVRVGHGPHGEQVALTHDACGRMTERRVERRGFQPKTWRYGWAVQDRLVRCERSCPWAWCSLVRATTITGLGRDDQAARVGRLTRGITA